MKSSILLFLVAAIGAGASAQVNTTSETGLGIVLSGGTQYFACTPQAPSKFTTLNIRLGAIVTHRLNDRFDLESGALLGVRLKRDAENTAQGYTIPPPFLVLDDVASARNHYFLSIPVLGVYKLHHPKLAFKAGLAYTFHFPNDNSVTFLTNRGEIGLVAGASLPLKTRLTLAVEYVHGLTELYSSGGTVDGIDYSLSVRHRLVSAGIHYRLTK